ncbi:hypothetical protein B0H14DRAFT_2710158 [Mycena olivaceomarginata]|nr:hypothetical protein B0H14DRAFT_2710158 [Mycena olivaceomarginata]
MPRASPKKPRISTASPTKPGTSTASPKKAPASPGINKRRKEWVESLPPPWVKQMNFRHSLSTSTITKTDAKKTYKLDDRDLETLPYEQRLSEKTGYMMLLYSQPQVSELGRRKAAKLGKPLDLSGPGTSIISVRNFPKLRDWEEHMLNPDPPPRKIVEYTSPPNPAKPDPTPITWTPSKISGAVSVADACRLYCIEPADIEDLSKHSKWIDLATVAKRAVSLHGGFYAHEELVHQRRDAEEQELTQVDDRKSRFRFSPMIQKQWEYVDEDDWMYAGRELPKHRVAVFYPIESVCFDDYGCMWDWVPYWGDF